MTGRRRATHGPRLVDRRRRRACKTADGVAAERCPAWGDHARLGQRLIRSASGASAPALDPVAWVGVARRVRKPGRAAQCLDLQEDRAIQPDADRLGEISVSTKVRKRVRLDQSWSARLLVQRAERVGASSAACLIRPICRGVE